MLKVVGAGLGRTGTNSLKLALERLLGAQCYHMLEVLQHREHIPFWTSAYQGQLPDWDQLFDGYAACVDWPAGPFWSEIGAANPDALILLSTRDPDAWWKSVSNTIFQSMDGAIAADDGSNAWTAMAIVMTDQFTPDWRDEIAAKKAFVEYNEMVRRNAPAERLLEWSPGEGWEPICQRLGLAVPDEPFPHVNSTEDFQAMLAGGPSSMSSGSAPGD